MRKDVEKLVLNLYMEVAKKSIINNSVTHSDDKMIEVVSEYNYAIGVIELLEDILLKNATKKYLEKIE